jgi:hypothetical protein
MDNLELENVKAKIEKLLALSTSPVSAEAQAALAKAHELMRKFNLSDTEIAYASQKIEGTKSAWQVKLAHHIARACCCFSLHNSAFNNVTIYGKKTNMFLADEFYKYLSKSVDRLSHACCEGRTEIAEFRNGMVITVCDRLDKEDTWQVDPKEFAEVKNYVDKTLHIRYSKGHASSIRYSEQGSIAGANLSLHRQAGSSGGIKYIS